MLQLSVSSVRLLFRINRHRKYDKTTTQGQRESYGWTPSISVSRQLVRKGKQLMFRTGSTNGPVTMIFHAHHVPQKIKPMHSDSKMHWPPEYQMHHPFIHNSPYPCQILRILKCSIFSHPISDFRLKRRLAICQHFCRF